MTSNHEECSNDITLENLKGSVQICRKNNEGTWGN